jgi:hypothetical protein
MRKVKITEHGDKRVRKRCGVPRKAVSRMAEKAFENGIKHSDTQGKLNKYMTLLFFKNTNANNIRIYGDKVYIFAGKTLITQLDLPNKLKKLAIKCMERKVVNG